MSQRQMVGVTGHQILEPRTRRLVYGEMKDVLSGENLVGISSLAAGADQIFAELILELGGEVIAILPCRHYEKSFRVADDLARCRTLLDRAEDIVVMPFDEPSEEAYWCAGREIVDRADWIVAVWDGKPARGLGGTADIVDYARLRGKRVEVIWPVGATRG